MSETADRILRNVNTSFKLPISSKSTTPKMATRRTFNRELAVMIARNAIRCVAAT